MNQTQALAKIKKLLGPKMGYRVDPKAPNAEQREDIRAQRAEAREARDAAVAARKARAEAVLAADAEYQRLKAAASAAEARLEALPSPHHKRITVGTVSDLFFNVKADGDNWAEVVEKLEASRA